MSAAASGDDLRSPNTEPTTELRLTLRIATRSRSSDIAILSAFSIFISVIRQVYSSPALPWKAEKILTNFEEDCGFQVDSICSISKHKVSHIKLAHLDSMQVPWSLALNLKCCSKSVKPAKT